MMTVNKPAAKALAMAIAAALCAQLAYAVTPTAVWDCDVSGQELNTTQGGLAIQAGYNNSFSNGKIVLAGQDNTGSSIILPSDVSSVSILVKYSNFSSFSSKNMQYPPVFASAIDSANHEIGLFATNNAPAFLFYWQQLGGESMAWNDRNPVDSAIALPSSASGYFLFSYSASSGVQLYIGDNPSGMTGAEKSNYHFSNKTISSISFGGAKAFTFNDGWPNLVIEKVALFTGEYLSASDVADFKFPSQVDVIDSDVTVSELNTKFGQDQEIDVYLADGVTVTGDTTFTATKVNFYCYGSFNMTPPANNEATFDFLLGQPILIYTNVLPSVSGSKFTSNVIPAFVTDPTKWTGTIWFKNMSVAKFAPSNFGNASSTVRLSGVSGHFEQGSISCTPAIELVNDAYNYGLNVNNGYSRSYGNGSNNVVVMSKLKGSGELWTGGSADTVLMQVLNWSEFSGQIQLVNKIVVFGSYLPTITEFNTAGGIYIGANETVEVPNGKEWRADGKIHVYGTLKATGVSQLKPANGNIPATIVHTYDSGTFTLTNTSNVNDTNTDYGQITGTGILKYESAGNWRTVSTSNFPTNMIVLNALVDGLILQNAGATYTIGSLSGNRKIRTDWNQGDRNLRILQAKDTTYSGLFDDAIDRMGTVTVAPGTSMAGTLTLSGTQRASNNLVVESGAKVNLTGTWVGPTTVSGTLSGTGTVSGALTLADGSTLVANTADPLTVSSLNLPAAGTVTISLADSDIGKDFIISSSPIDTTGKKFAFTVNGEPTNLTVIKTAGGLKAVRPGMKIIFR